jgi:hypothetical protein
MNGILSPIFFYIGTWAALIGGIWAFFNATDSVVVPDIKIKISAWIKGFSFRRHRSHSGNILFEAFIAYFGQKHFSWRCISRSFILSLELVLLTLLAYLASGPLAMMRHLMLDVESYIPFCILCIIQDYFALYKTRLLLNFFARMNIAAILLLDFITTIIIAYIIFVPIAFLMNLYDGQFIGIEQLSSYFVEAYLYPNLNAIDPYIAFYSIFIGSIWLWLYVFSVLLLNMTMKLDVIFFRVKGFLDIDKSPFSSLAVIMILFVTVVFIVALPFYIFYFGS